MAPGAVVGIVLAAGAGSRAGGPKVLRRDASGVPWVELAVRRLLDGGCSSVLVVLGAAADQAREVVPADAVPVVCDNWTDGLSASLRTGLAAAGTGWGRFLTRTTDTPGMGWGRFLTRTTDTPGTGWEPSPTRATDSPVAAVIVPVDVPDGSPATVRRLLVHASASGLARAVFHGRPGHPVLIGRAHWTPLGACLSGDVGASHYLASNGAITVECGDLEAGLDVDR